MRQLNDLDRMMVGIMKMHNTILWLCGLNVLTLALLVYLVVR